MNEVPSTPAQDTSLVKPGWVVLIVGWVIMLVPFPGTGWIGGMIAGIGGTVLAIINLTRGLTGVGIAQLLCALLVTPVVYWVGFMIFAGSVVSAVSAP